ncbi:MAG TPA: hypothetical protein VG963_16185 [Polyangiaceae bacterium]|nr:hypothetical protein [Polyangiaceae bacterium]
MPLLRRFWSICARVCARAEPRIAAPRRDARRVWTAPVSFVAATAWSALGLAPGCVQAIQTYPVVAQAAAPSASGLSGSISVERIEGGQRLLVLSLERLPPPERIAPGLREFVVWLEDARGGEVKIGTLHYDRAHHSGNLLATTDLTAFTLRVTGERDGQITAPSGVLLAERRVVIN